MNPSSLLPSAPANAGVLSAALVASLLLGCKPAAEEAPAPAPTTQTAPTSAAPTGEPCALTRSVTLIESIRLESDDGSCKVYLPMPLRAGEFTVRVSSAGGGDFAAVEVAGQDGTLYATSGTVTLTEVSDTRVVGTIAAEDDSPPAMGTVSTDFDVALTSH